MLYYPLPPSVAPCATRLRMFNSNNKTRYYYVVNNIYATIAIISAII